MPHEVKMPQLGMAQASGVIVSWLKAAGDAVTRGEALFEVETDKATMEVEAPVGGWLAGVRAGEGDDVPVGDVIALIVESESEVSEHASADTMPEVEQEAGAAPAEEGAAAPVEVKVPETAAPPAAPRNAPATSGKVLASPKARRLALEGGIDLGALRSQGVPEPIRAADLVRVATAGPSLLTAEASGEALDALLAHSDEADRTTLFAAFAAGAWRTLFDQREVGVAMRGLDGTETAFGDAERAALTLVDLCDSRLTAYAPARTGILLAVARRDACFALTLSFSETTLPLAQAVALLDDIAARVEDPIRQLL